MDYCRICPECGARLDPGEICDCQSDIDPAAAQAEADRENGEG